MISWLRGSSSGEPEDALEGGSLVEGSPSSATDEIALKLANLQQHLEQEKEAHRATKHKMEQGQLAVAAQMEQVYTLQRENNDLNWRLSEMQEAELQDDLRDARELARAHSEDRDRLFEENERLHELLCGKGGVVAQQGTRKQQIQESEDPALVQLSERIASMERHHDMEDAKLHVIEAALHAHASELDFSDIVDKLAASTKGAEIQNAVAGRAGVVEAGSDERCEPEKIDKTVLVRLEARRAAQHLQVLTEQSHELRETVIELGQKRAVEAEARMEAERNLKLLSDVMQQQSVGLQRAAEGYEAKQQEQQDAWEAERAQWQQQVGLLEEKVKESEQELAATRASETDAQDVEAMRESYEAKQQEQQDAWEAERAQWQQQVGLLEEKVKESEQELAATRASETDAQDVEAMRESYEAKQQEQQDAWEAERAQWQQQVGLLEEKVKESEQELAATRASETDAQDVEAMRESYEAKQQEQQDAWEAERAQWQQQVGLLEEKVKESEQELAATRASETDAQDVEAMRESYEAKQQEQQDAWEAERAQWQQQVGLLEEKVKESEQELAATRASETDAQDVEAMRESYEAKQQEQQDAWEAERAQWQQQVGLLEEKVKESEQELAATRASETDAQDVEAMRESYEAKQQEQQDAWEAERAQWQQQVGLLEEKVKESEQELAATRASGTPRPLLQPIKKAEINTKNQADHRSERGADSYSDAKGSGTPVSKLVAEARTATDTPNSNKSWGEIDQWKSDDDEASDYDLPEWSDGGADGDSDGG